MTRLNLNLDDNTKENEIGKMMYLSHPLLTWAKDPGHPLKKPAC